MENKNERVLAYKLAVVVDKEKLTEVAGGSHMSSRTTLRPTGAGRVRDMDAFVDISIDM